MHCLFFDVRPKSGHMPHYFDHVERLKPVLARHDGLIYLERFQPEDAAEALLSHQLWRDEAAIEAWRRDPSHRVSQAAGRRVHFEDYRIRVGRQVLHLPGPPGAELPEGRLLVAAYGTAPGPGLDRRYQSVTRPGRVIALSDATTAAKAASLAETALRDGAEEVRVFLIERDYTMTDRSQAPEREAENPGQS